MEADALTSEPPGKPINKRFFLSDKDSKPGLKLTQKPGILKVSRRLILIDKLRDSTLREGEWKEMAGFSF